jgi:hypothetical protein
MSFRPSLLALSLFAIGLPSAAVHGDNPIIQTKFTADPAPLVHDGVVYLYTSHDEDDAEGFKMLDWRLYSATDMVNWTDRGVVASLATLPWAVQRGAANHRLLALRPLIRIALRLRLDHCDRLCRQGHVDRTIVEEHAGAFAPAQDTRYTGGSPVCV